MKSEWQHLGCGIRRNFLALAICLVSSVLVSVPTVQSQSPTDTHVVFVYLRGFADIALQMIQPKRVTGPGFGPGEALFAVRPNIYDPNINNYLLTGTEYGRHELFTVLTTIQNAGELAIVQRVGLDNSIPSHSVAELAYAYGNPDARTGPRSGWLQRLAQSYFSDGYELIDLSGGHPTTSAGGGFVPLSVYHAQQYIGFDGTLDAVFFGTESGFRRDMFYRMMRATGINSNAEKDAIQRRFARLGEMHSTLVAGGAPAGYATNPAGFLFRDAESIIAYSRGASAKHKNKVVFGILDGWDTHALQNTTSNANADFRNGVSALNAALTNFRTRGSAPGAGWWANTVVVIYTDGGRSTRQNQQQGTDHGDSNAVLLVGGKVKGGVYGTAPTIANFEDRTSVIARDLNWTDVLADIVAGMGYDPAAVWPGYARRGIGLIK